MAKELSCVTTTGLTLTGKMVQGTTVVTTGITMTESAIAGYYTGDASGVAGNYNILILNGAAVVATGTLNWNGTAEVHLTFTKANELDVNVHSINNETITGNGQPGTEFGV